MNDSDYSPSDDSPIDSNSDDGRKQSESNGKRCDKCQKVIKGNSYHFRRHLEAVHKKKKRKAKQNEGNKEKVLKRKKKSRETENSVGYCGEQQNDKRNQPDDDDDDMPGVSGTTKQQQSTWQPINSEKLEKAGAGDENEMEDEEAYLREFAYDIEDFERPFTNGFELNVELARGEQMNRKFYRKAVRKLKERLRGRVAMVRAEAGLLLRSRINGTLRYFYPGSLSSLTSVQIDNEREGAAILLRKLCAIDLNSSIWQKFMPDSSWEVVKHKKLLISRSIKGIWNILSNNNKKQN